MKNRFNFLYKDTLYVINYGGANPPPPEIYVSRPVVGIDRLTVQSQYVGQRIKGSAHPFAWDKSVYSDFLGSTIETQGSTSKVLTGRIRAYTPTQVPTLDMSGLYNSAASSLYDKVRNQIDLSVSIAEAGQTRKMFGQYRTPASYETWNKYSKRFGSKIATLVDLASRLRPKEWANKWLEYQYGWRPLVNDIYETGKQLMDFHTFSYVRVVGTASVSANKAATNVVAGSGYPGSGIIVSDRTVRRARCKIVCEYKMSQSRLQSLSNYTSLNPVSIAWELLPYSFVVDWVLNVGGYLRSLESSMLFQDQFVRGWSSTGQLIESNAQVYGSYMPPGGSYTESGSAFQRDVVQSRSILSSTPRPYFPSVSAKLGWQRAVSGAALLSQFLGRKS